MILVWQALFGYLWAGQWNSGDSASFPAVSYAPRDMVVRILGWRRQAET